MKKLPTAFIYGLIVSIIEIILLLLAICLSQKNSVSIVLSSIGWVALVCAIPAILTGFVFASATKPQSRRSLIASKTSTASLLITFICFNIFLVMVFYAKPALLGNPPTLFDGLYLSLGHVFFASLASAFVSFLTAHIYLSAIAAKKLSQ